jgi:hypothetical protein
MMSGPASTLRREKPVVMDEKMTQFHRELMETAIDALARYTFGNMNNTFQRSELSHVSIYFPVDFFLENKKKRILFLL